VFDRGRSLSEMTRIEALLVKISVLFARGT